MTFLCGRPALERGYVAVFSGRVELHVLRCAPRYMQIFNKSLAVTEGRSAQLSQGKANRRFCKWPGANL